MADLLVINKKFKIFWITCIFILQSVTDLFSSISSLCIFKPVFEVLEKKCCITI